jgi:hypothetical protein
MLSLPTLVREVFPPRTTTLIGTPWCTPLEHHPIRFCRRYHFKTHDDLPTITLDEAFRANTNLEAFYYYSIQLLFLLEFSQTITNIPDIYAWGDHLVSHKTSRDCRIVFPPKTGLEQHSGVWPRPPPLSCDILKPRHILPLTENSYILTLNIFSWRYCVGKRVVRICILF